MTVRLDANLLRRVPLDGTFTMRYIPFTPDHGIVYREDSSGGGGNGLFVEADGSDGWQVEVTGEAIQRVIASPDLALDSDGLHCGLRRVVDRDLSKHDLSFRVLQRYIEQQGGRWWRTGDVLIVVTPDDRVMLAKRLLEEEWTFVTATFPPPQSPTPNS